MTNQAKFDFAALSSRKFDELDIAKATEGFKAAVSEAWHTACDLHIYNAKLTADEISAILVQFGQQMDYAMKWYAALSASAAIFQAIAHIDDNLVQETDESQDIVSNDTQALPEVLGIDETGEEYDLESPTTMRDLA